MAYSELDTMTASETIHLIFKTHLDIGFTDFARNVVKTYFDVFIPSAIDTARKLKEIGSSDRFIWTTGSWLIYEYLEQGTTEQRKALEQAIEAGDIRWHGLPFTTHTELMSQSLFKYGLTLSQKLDNRFGKTTISGKMTDVPGHTRGMVPLLSEAGLRFIHLGANAASTPPDVPPTFVWRDVHSNTKVMVMYQKGGYGGLIRVPGLAHTLAFAHTNDNHGAQSVEEVQKIYHDLRETFPNAQIIGSTMDAFAEQLITVEDQLPVIEQELGDTWIHGTASDPLKVSRYRELVRLREEWLESGKIQANDPILAAFNNKLMMVPEHTWGMDEKVHLADYTNYTKAKFQTARKSKVFRNYESSWTEQRAYVDDAVKALGTSELAKEAQERLKRIKAKLPDKVSYEPINGIGAVFDTPHFKIGFDNQTGAVNYLVEKISRRKWASAEHVLGWFRYQTFSKQDYDQFWKRYIINKRETKFWSWDDYTKPGMSESDSESRFWSPKVSGFYSKKDNNGQSFLLELKLPEAASCQYGAPQVINMIVSLPNNEPVIDFDLQWFEKPANRLPEAAWMSFNPVTRRSGQWTMDKLGSQISPLDVIRNGNRKLHGVETGLTYTDNRGQLTIKTLDAALVAPGEPSLLNFNNRQPNMKNGMHFNLLNNIWGTNFQMWYDDDTRFRFRVKWDG
ncbi:MAG: DUF5054 domain-containing protein [Anaerolineaceae bacterium]|nr:DUF5054 domain-containing protein [Anaerolineaceae bacterium]